MSSTKPKWTQPDALRRGKTATRLAVKHASVIEPYLSPGARDELLEARARLGDESAASALGNQTMATAAKSDVATKLEDLVMAARNAVDRTRGATEEQRKAVGIGEELTVPKLLAQVARIQSKRDILAACGVIAPVVDAMVAGATTLRANIAAQGDAMDTRAETTEERTDAHLTIERFVDEISSRGALAFELAGDPVTRDRFLRLVSGSGPTAEDEAEAGTDETTTTTTTPTDPTPPVVTP